MIFHTALRFSGKTFDSRRSHLNSFVSGPRLRLHSPNFWCFITKVKVRERPFSRFLTIPTRHADVINPCWKTLIFFLFFFCIITRTSMWYENFLILFKIFVFSFHNFLLFLRTFFLSLIEPLPLTIILQPVSCSNCFAVMPRGPRILPTKLN